MGSYTGFLLRDELFYSNYQRVKDIVDEKNRSDLALDLQEKKIRLAIIAKERELASKKKKSN